ncbi:unnamed protein product [Brassicogethes aeneus]|uniref:Coiled-coil protein 142 C-terminal domain-containing protein n=1 Tax=Brassicogethes aeneus TaxID=1431903 RepID=A0A9P0B6T9_BRAAE|nr:unnamed protein product [Brassicogethes aeneus]
MGFTVKQFNNILPKLTVDMPIVSNKMKLWMDMLTKVKLKITFFIQELLLEIASFYIYYGENVLVLTLKISTSYNALLQMDSRFNLTKNTSVCNNTCPYLMFPIRKISVTRLLQIIAQSRAELCCHKLIDCLLETYKMFDTHEDEANSENSSLEIYLALTKHMSPPIEIEKKDPKKDKITNLDETQSFQNLEELITYEEKNVIDLLETTLKVAPLMLGHDGVKKSRNKENLKINEKARDKVLDYYEEILWGEVGNYLEHVILWWTYCPMSTRPPHSSQHLREWINQFLPTADIPGVLLSALSTLADALGVHVTSTSWDQQFRLALVASKSTNNSETGKLFLNVLQDLVMLCNQCESTPDWIIGAPLDELPLVEQIPVLHRLDHSIHTTRLWAANETKKLANTWNVDSFFGITHGDIVNCLSQLNGLRMTDHSIQIEKGGLGVHVEVCTLMRAKLVSEVVVNGQKLKDTPSECIEVLASVCRTICLANLQMIFPKNPYWKKIEDIAPDKPSDYVEKYLERILTPVIAATDDYAINDMILKLICESWLDHIYINKIKFSHYGACQLLCDFAHVATWLINSTIVTQSVRKKLVKNEILRRCEGVGKLLLRCPGDHLKMADKNKKPPKGEENESEVGAELMPAEMYVPNQEQWLELRAVKRKVLFPTTLCCGNNMY